MHLINIYYANIHDWNIELLKKNLLQDDFRKFESIRHIPTLNLKILNRVLLRYIFANKYGIREDQIIFEYNDREKPSIKNFPSIYFNCSHSEDMVLIGISENCQLGVDIELIETRKDENAIAKLFFSFVEYSCYEIYRLHCIHAFYKFWTAKEGVIKALGKGLWETDKIPEVVLLNDQLVLRSKSNILKDWSIIFLDIHKDYTACLVANHMDIKVNTIRLKPEN